MIKRISILFLLAAAAGIGANAQVISPIDQRSSLVDSAEAVIGNVNREPGDYSSVASPFLVVEKEVEVAPATVTSSTTTVARSAPQVLTDAVALRAVSQQFKPIGSLVLGDRGLLQLGNGRTIERGSTFTAEIQGTSYEVMIEDVTKSGYTLRLGNERIQKSFLQSGK